MHSYSATSVLADYSILLFARSMNIFAIQGLATTELNRPEIFGRFCESSLKEKKEEIRSVVGTHHETLLILAVRVTG